MGQNARSALKAIFPLFAGADIGRTLLAKLVAFYSQMDERGACSAKPSTELSRENFFYPGKVRRPEFQNLWPSGSGRAEVGLNHRHVCLDQQKRNNK